MNSFNSTLTICKPRSYRLDVRVFVECDVIEMSWYLSWGKDGGKSAMEVPDGGVAESWWLY